jgi:hypothetical protein
MITWGYCMLTFFFLLWRCSGRSGCWYTLGGLFACTAQIMGSAVLGTHKLDLAYNFTKDTKIPPSPPSEAFLAVTFLYVRAYSSVSSHLRPPKAACGTKLIWTSDDCKQYGRLPTFRVPLCRRSSINQPLCCEDCIFN